MNVIHRRGWEIPESSATPEHVFLNRRTFLGAARAPPHRLRRASRLPSASPTFPIRPWISIRPRTTRSSRSTARSRRGDQRQLQQFLRVRLTKKVAKAAQALRSGLDRQDRRHGGEAVEIGIDDLIRKMPLRGAALSPSLRRGLVDDDPVDRLSVGKLVELAKPLSSAKYVRWRRSWIRRSRRARSRPGIRGPISRA